MEMLKKAQAGEAVKISAEDDDDDSEGQKEGMSEEGDNMMCLDGLCSCNCTLYCDVTPEKKCSFFSIANSLSLSI